MRKFIIPALAAASILGVSEASAFTHDVQLTATVDKICSFVPPVTSGNGQITSITETGSIFDIDIDAQGQSLAVTDSLKFANAFCNAPTTVRLERTFLRHTVLTQADGFAL